MKRALVLTYAIVFATFAWFTTYGTGTFFDLEWLSASYDSLASSLLRGEADVDSESISFEGLKRDGKTFMYFGPFPALLRVVLNAIFPAHAGLWGRVSCFLAASLSAVVFGMVVVRTLRLNESLESRTRVAVAALLILSFSLGTPLLYLASCGRIFHEASLWALFGGLLALYGILLLCTGTERPLLGRAVFSVALAVALLSRITFAVPICLAAPVVFLWRITSEPGGAARAAFLRLAVMIPAAFGAVFQLWYNYERFGSPFVFFDYQTFYIKPQEIGGEFNLARLPTTVSHYFGFFWGYFSDTPPYARMISSEITRPELFMRHWREQTISLTFASCAVMLFAALGFSALLKRRAPALLAVYSACLLSQALLILTYFFITQRYSADFLPLLAAGIAVASLTLSCRRGLIITLGLLAAVSVSVTSLSILDWTMAFNQHAPNPVRRKLAEAFLPPLALGRAAERVYLSDQRPIAQSDSGTPTRGDRSAVGNQLSWVGTLFPKGLGMRANASSTYTVPPGFDRFQAIVMPAHESTHLYDCAVKFVVTNDAGAEIFNSGTVDGRGLPKSVDVALNGTSTVTLSLSTGEGQTRGDFGNWNMASFAKSTP
jgi:hypothetical protein